MGLVFAIGVLLLGSGSASARTVECSGTYRAPNGLGLAKIKATGVACSTARKTTTAWGRAWAQADYPNVVRFYRVRSWRCVYTFRFIPDASYGSVKCAATGGRRVAFRVLS